MDEEDFEALRGWKPFSSNDVKNAERLPALGLALWGRTPEDLRRRLLTVTPRVPAGCALADLQVLLHHAQQLLGYFRARVSKHPTVLGHLRPTETIVVGEQHFNVLEARCEIARRAIRWLEARGGLSSSGY